MRETSKAWPFIIRMVNYASSAKCWPDGTDTCRTGECETTERSAHDLDSRARETRERACGINITCTGVSISISTVQPTTRSRCSAWSFRQAAAQPDWSGTPSSKKHSGSATRLSAADTVSWTKRVDPATKSGPARWMARPITTASQTCGFSGTTAKRSMMAFPSSGDKYRPRRHRHKSPDSSVETRWTVKT